MSNARDFFLLPQNYSDYDKYRGAIRKARGIKPLVDGQAIFSDMEREIVQAKRAVLIASWSFHPGLSLQTKEAQKTGKNWLDLLIATAKRDVKVRVFTSDFDPLLQYEKHAVAWLRYRLTVAEAKKAGVGKEQFQMVVARHEAEVPPATARLAGLAGLDAAVATIINQRPVKERARIFANAPGLWTALKWDTKSAKIVAKKKDAVAAVYPASYHQKIVWIDGRVAFVGGINLIEENLDTPKHQREALPWHDLFVRLEGGPLRDIRRNYVGIWNKERKRMEAFLKTANAASSVPEGMPGGLTTDLTEKELPMSAPDRQKRPVAGQIHRTISHNSSGNVPDVIRKDVIDGYLKAIGLAEKFIYIENQYLRSKTLAEALIKRHQTIKQLRTIIVLPQIAEELLEKKADAITLHGAYLQYDAIDRMQKAIGANLGVFSLIKDQKQIYVHSKLLIVDDRYANVGSANDNPRSFLMDTELNFAWYDQQSAMGLRLKLWVEILGAQRDMAKWKPQQFVAKWNKIARHNARVAPNKRHGLVIPFSNSEKGKESKLIPDEFASLMTPGDVEIA